jgi:DNA-binding TFAR19-related protein (PDSD5 family)
LSEDDDYSDEELDELRRRRYSDLQRAAIEEQRQAESRRQFEAQKQAALGKG